MKKQTMIKNGFYKGFLDSQEQDEKTLQQKEQIVIVNQKEKDSFINILLNALGAVFRICSYALLFILSSIGLSSLLNEYTREFLLNIILCFCQSKISANAHVKCQHLLTPVFSW
jgi:hypothetical protein